MVANAQNPCFQHRIWPLRLHQISRKDMAHGFGVPLDLVADRVTVVGIDQHGNDSKTASAAHLGRGNPELRSNPAPLCTWQGRSFHAVEDLVHDTIVNANFCVNKI